MSRNLQDEAELFLASLRLNSAATGLRKLANEEKNSGIENKDIEWAEKLMQQIDWNSGDYCSDPKLCVIATKLRPLFYQTLLNQGILDVPDFSKGIIERKKEIYEIFESMTRSILTEINSSHMIGYI